MTKLNYLTLLAALALPVLAADDKRTLPLLACLSNEDIAATTTLKAEYSDGTPAEVGSSSFDVQGLCEKSKAAQQVQFGELEVSAAKGSQAGFTLHTSTKSGEILKQTCTVTVQDWPAEETIDFYGTDVAKVFPEQKDVRNKPGDGEGLFSIRCLGVGNAKALGHKVAVAGASSGVSPQSSATP